MNPERRVKALKFREFEILEEHEDEYKASMREQELQREYGYAIDTRLYTHTSKLHTYRTEEGNKRISEAMKVREVSEETRAKISKHTSEYSNRPEVKQKRSEARKNFVYTEEIRKKISENNKKEKNCWYGTKYKYIEVTTGYIGTFTDMLDKFGIHVYHYARKGRPVKRGKFKGLYFKIYAQ